MESDHPDINTVQHAHLIGIAGAGMTPLATILCEMGIRVTGSDLVDAPHLETLRRLGAEIWIGHDPARLGSPEVVVTTAAAHQDNPEIAAAQERSIPIVKHATALADLMRPRRGIAVAGTHGKSTTTAMVAHILSVNRLDPTFHVGAELTDYHVFGHLGNGDYLVAEADEFDRRFLAYDPEIAVVTYAEPDHLDYFGTYEAMLEAYAQFIRNVRPGGTVVTNADDPAAAALPVQSGRVTYGRSPDVDWQTLDWKARPIGGVVRVRDPEGHEHEFPLGVLGRHNADNAAAALAVAYAAGVTPDQAGDALASFHGVSRRLQMVGQADGVTVVDDYAHHPTEIRAALAALSAHWKADPDRTPAIWAIFQPHTEHRTTSLFDAFRQAFTDADHVLITPAYMPSGRLLSTEGASSQNLVRALPHPDARYVDSEAAIDLTSAGAAPGDVVVVMGAGDIWTVEEPLLASLRARQTGPRR
jgi:UDP-N-acetylmuramate--alanine ligase